MSIFNPVLGNKIPKCRCKDCFHAFWCRSNSETNYLICNCDLMHFVTFPTDSEKIIICKGCEDNIPHSDRADRSACLNCKNSLWYVTDKRRLYCYCLHLQKLVYGLDAKQKLLPLIVDCNGISPIQQLMTEDKIEPTEIN